MSRPILSLLACLLLGCAPAMVEARTATARIARVSTAVAVMHGVQVSLHWPAGASSGDLRVRAQRVEATDLGYRFKDLDWRCPLRRGAAGTWQCQGVVSAAGGAPLRLAVDLSSAATDVVLARGDASLALHRTASAPDDTVIDLVRVPLPWAQALVALAWKDGQLGGGTLDGRMTVNTPTARPLRVHGELRLRDAGVSTSDAAIAAEGVGALLAIDFRKLGLGDRATSLVALAGELHGGEVLFGSTYIALPDTPVALEIDARQPGTGTGWELPRIHWGDGTVLQATGSALLAPDLAVRALEMTVHSEDLAPLVPRYLSGNLAAVGMAGTTLAGAADLTLRLDADGLAALDARLHDVAITDPLARFGFAGLDGDLRLSAGAAVDSLLRWRSGRLYGIDFGATALPMRAEGGRVRLRQAVSIPALGGSLRFDTFALQPPARGQGMEVAFGLALADMDLGQLAAALDLPAFRGTLSGTIPRARYADDRLVFDGGLDIGVFDGSVALTSLSMERPFGVAPTLSADIAIEDLDLLAITEVFGFGSITGRLDGRIDGLRLVDWGPTAFDARLQTQRHRGVRQRISQRAVQNISSVGDASFVGSLQGQLIGLFDDFGYSRIGIACRLANEICTMGGLGSAGPADAASPGFLLVSGAGIPHLDVVGYNRLVDWPTLVERLAAVGSGEVKPVFE